MYHSKSSLSNMHLYVLSNLYNFILNLQKHQITHYCKSLGMTVNGTIGLLASSLAAVRWQSLAASGWLSACRTVPKAYLMAERNMVVHLKKSNTSPMGFLTTTIPPQ